MLANELRFAKDIVNDFRTKENKKEEQQQKTITASKRKHLMKMFVKGVKNQNSEDSEVIKSRRKSSIYDKIFDIKRVNSVLLPKHRRVISHNTSSTLKTLTF